MLVGRFYGADSKTQRGYKQAHAGVIELGETWPEILIALQEIIGNMKDAGNCVRLSIETKEGKATSKSVKL